ncbi:myosin-binding protein 2 [Heracleum sosnowskyi]|uniref:Myosin-binding protein 2 n=1 Tax=Heracleum sosnowskyi TaxID=360622 RepID=A0AAD8MPG3_9APIA|nr:myosin-binding protein 2 [Heracleum sosnowskyi]
MDTNKFSTMLHRNSIKIKHTLVFVVLEWTLISFLLLNALIQFMIVKFSNYFGLKPPCLWCSRIDHLMEPRKCSNLHRDHVCKAHGKEVSKLGYCSIHQKLADYQSMCEDCSSSSRPDLSMKFNFAPWAKATGVIHNDEDMVIQNGVEGLQCSCCGVILERQIYSPYVLINPSNWDHFKYDVRKEDLITEEGETDDHGTKDDKADHTETDFIIEHFNGDHGFKSKSYKQTLSSIDGVPEEDIELNEEIVGIMMTDPSSDENVNQHCHEQDASFEIPQQHLEFFIDCTGQQLVPVESIGSTTKANEIQYMVEENEKNGDHPESRLRYEYDIAAQVVSGPGNVEETKSIILEFMEAQEAENYLIVPAKDCDSVHEQVTQINVQDTAPYFLSVSEEVLKMQILKTEKEALTRSETALVDMEERDQDAPVATEDVSPFIMSDSDTEVSIGTEIPDLNSTEDNNCLQEEASASCTDFHVHYEHGSETDSQETVDLSTFMIELNDHKINSQSSVYFEINGNEDENLCERPSSSDGHYDVQKTLLFHERKDSGDEKSVEGSVTSELDDEVIMTVEHLNSTLRAERKALDVAYAELEEERNASAIAANQTMAMINRLQEEKAAMQMEALHYQRMMEEKSEYDQEAMQIMNDLMMKMDKERQGFEIELEICRKKLLVYEAKENMGMLRRSKDESVRVGFSSVSCSIEEDSDEISIDLNKEENRSYDHQGNENLNTPVEEVLHFRDRFGNIDEERWPVFPLLLDANVGENENEESSVHYNGFDGAFTKFKLKDRRTVIEKEVDQLYGMMNTLKTDIVPTS